MSKTSIILPYYNRKNYLITTLDSFQRLYSSNEDFEVVIVDDGSNDENRVEDIIGNYNLDINHTYIENNDGVNPCYVYNVGVRKSKGDI